MARGRAWWVQMGLGNSPSLGLSVLFFPLFFSSFFLFLLLLGEGGGFPYAFICIGSVPCSPTYLQRTTLPFMLWLKKKRHSQHSGELLEGHLNQLSIMDAKKLLAETRASD